MKKYLFMLFALCAVAFTACSDDDDDSKVLPVLDPNNTDVYINAEGGEASVTVKNAKELNIVQINDKTTDDKGKTKETNVKSVENGKLTDTKNVTEGGWFTAKVVNDGGGYRRIVFNAQPYRDFEKNRVKFIHVTCGDNMYGIAFRLIQRKAVEKK